MARHLCIDIGGTSIKFAICSQDGKILKKLPSFTTQNQHQGIVDTVISVIKDYKDLLNGVAISSAGIIDTDKGEVIHSGYTIPGYTHTNWKKVIKEATGLNCEVENDVNSAALGEKWLGALKESNNAVCLTIGTGIGGALFLEGNLYRGLSFSAGEVGYMTFGDKNFQDNASTSALVNRVENSIGKSTNGIEIFEQAKNGNSVCQEEISQMIKYLCKGLANIIYLFAPEKIVLGGGIMAQKEYLIPLINDQLAVEIEDSFFLKTKIEAASLGNDANLLGALYHFLQKQN